MCRLFKTFKQIQFEEKYLVAYVIIFATLTIPFFAPWLVCVDVGPVR